MKLTLSNQWRLLKNNEVFSLNCRRLGKSHAALALKGLFDKTHSPNIVFLSKTKLFQYEFSNLKFSLSYNNALVVDCSNGEEGQQGKSGCLALLWKINVDLAIQSFSKSYID